MRKGSKKIQYILKQELNWKGNILLTLHAKKRL